jgi:hypothetical protein
MMPYETVSYVSGPEPLNESWKYLDCRLYRDIE